MPVTFKQVDAYAAKLPGVTVGTKWGNHTWLVGEKGFIWQRPLSKTDLARLGDATPPSGEILGVRTENLDAKDALLAMDLPGFFTIQHFNCYPAVLVELRKARAADVRLAIEEAHRAVVASGPAKKRKAAKKPAKKRPRSR